ncbi:MAG: hypothetical protein H0V17_09365 [Deltaproteobacteria bacterium]|nr:hypothetical protein [Deltaproteobacteria bacterium]
MLALAACDPETQRATAVAEAADQPGSRTLEGGVYRRVSTAHGPLHVWTPANYTGRGDIVVYVHGYSVTADQAWTEHRLAAQFAASGLDAMFIACEAPASVDEPVSWSSLSELLGTAQRAIGQELPDGRVAVVGHSGAHRTVLPWLPESQLDTLVLVDAVHGDVERWRTWATEKRERRLVFVGGDTREWSDQLHATLPEIAVLEGIPALDAQLPEARFVYIKSDLGHLDLVRGDVLPGILRLVPEQTSRDTGTPVAGR